MADDAGTKFRTDLIVAALRAERDWSTWFEANMINSPGPLNRDQYAEMLRVTYARMALWGLSSLFGWLGEQLGADTQSRAVEMVRDMAENGGADWIDDLLPIAEQRIAAEDADGATA